MFAGGYTELSYADTWEYDGTNWTELSVGTMPRRTGQGTVYDSYRGCIVHFGGSIDPSFAWRSDETRELTDSYIVESRLGGHNYIFYSETGSWTDSSAKSTAFGTMPEIGSRFASSLDTSAMAIFSTPPGMPYGMYEVYITWGTSSSNAADVEAEIAHAGGVSYTSVDQTTNFNTWVNLGSYNFQGSAKVTIRSSAAVAGAIRSDAVRFVWRGPAPPPRPVVDAGDNLQIISADQACTVVLGTATDPDGDPLQYRWLEGENTLLNWTDVGPNGEAYLVLATLPYFSIGNHTLTLEAREVRAGGLSASDQMILTIENSPPAVQPAPSSQVVEIGIDPIVIVADVSDFDGDTLLYEWVKDNEVLTSGSVDTVQGGDIVPIPDLIFLAGDPRFPVGIHQIELRARDGVNDPVTAFVSVKVIDTTAPSLSPIPSITILWPPNHELRPVLIQANAYDNGGGDIHLDVSVESNELPDTDGDGNTILDYYVDSIDDETGIIELRLRSERRGKGDGRVYTVLIRATDESSNQSDAIVEILAPHDRRKL